ncbi:MAG: hypothetical protein FWF82_03410 [Oscillospiraceae bacterium]|nr:hypothetical protein [Oscillospiraceae bacterium]
MFEIKFIELLKKYPESTANRRKLTGLLRDFFPLESKRTRLLINLHELGICEDIEKSGTLNDRFAYRYVKGLVEEFGVDSVNATRSVYTWCLCYGEGILGKPCRIKVTDDAMAYSMSPDNGESEESGNNDRDGIFVPCDMGDVGKAGHGYVIHGIIQSRGCGHTYANVYAAVFNYLVRKVQMSGEDIPEFFKVIKTPFAVDYVRVFRLMTVILQLIKNNYITDSTVNIQYDGNVGELKCALMIIGNYTDLFCTLAGFSPPPPLSFSAKTKPVKVSFLSESGVYVKDCESPRNDVSLWNAGRINYRLNADSVKSLDYILGEVGGVGESRKLNKIQFEALKKVLTSNSHCDCFMKEGEGLPVVLLTAILQPVPVFVGLDDDSRIESQIRILKEDFRFDNISRYDPNCDNNNAGLTFLTEKESDGFESGGLGFIFVTVKSEEMKYSSYSLAQVGILVAGGISRESLNSVLRLNKVKYSRIFDCLLFLAALRYDGVFDSERFERILSESNQSDLQNLVLGIAAVYGLCEDEVKLQIHANVEASLREFPYDKFVNAVYAYSKKDIVYYGVLASKLNRKFGIGKVEK